MAAQILVTAWTILLLYVLIDIRRVMSFNSANNARLRNGWPTEVNDRNILLNRIAVLVLLAVTDAIALTFLF